MGNAHDTIQRLVECFTRQSDHIPSPDYSETLIRFDFIKMKERIALVEE